MHRCRWTTCCGYSAQCAAILQQRLQCLEPLFLFLGATGSKEDTVGLLLWIRDGEREWLASIERRGNRKLLQNHSSFGFLFLETHTQGTQRAQGRRCESINIVCIHRQYKRIRVHTRGFLKINSSFGLATQKRCTHFFFSCTSNVPSSTAPSPSADSLAITRADARLVFLASLIKPFLRVLTSPVH
jgi:hypothetical protein